jgi:O-antigen ligase
VGGQPHLVLLPCVLVMAAGPFISASHGGAVVAAGLAAGALAIVVAAGWHSSPTMRLTMLAPIVIGVLMVLYLGTGQFRNGLLQAFMDDMGDRIEIHETARQMAVDRPVFGTGPGSFAKMYQLYRSDPREVWAAYAHNDWLQTLITFGWVGGALVWLALLHVFLRWWVRDGIECPWDLIAAVWLALAACLAHARFDFPLQIHSILLLFLTFCCVACCTGRKV